MKQGNYRSVSLRRETVELLATIKACYQLANKETLTNDEIISKLLPLGVEKDSAKVAALLQTLKEDLEDDNDSADLPEEDFFEPNADTTSESSVEA